jgi:hypothetical protein
MWVRVRVTDSGRHLPSYQPIPTNAMPILRRYPLPPMISFSLDTKRMNNKYPICFHAYYFHMERDNILNEREQKT